MKKVPTIVLSVSYKGVKFIDATNKVCAIMEYYLLFLTTRRNTYEGQSREGTDLHFVFSSPFFPCLLPKMDVM